MRKIRIRSLAVTVSSAGVVLSTFLALSSLAVTGTASAAEPLPIKKARAWLMPAEPASPLAVNSARAVALPIDELGLRTELPSVRFDFASAALRPADRKILDANAEWLRANPDRSVVLEGAADPRGSRTYNLSLGERRVTAVRDYLVARGVAAERITFLSTGEAQQACRSPRGACWTLDRRVDFLVRESKQAR
jgi:peptidoglycan-associated lipoprotein